jgi:hypothetical protein
MDLQKAKVFLDKINREFASMQTDPENISTIDVDLMRQYTRDFYDAILSEKKSVLVNSPAPQIKETPAQKAPSRPIGFNPERNQSVAPKEVFEEKQTLPPVQKIVTSPIEEIIRQKPAPVFEVEQIVAKAPEPAKKTAPIVEPAPIYRPTIEQIQAEKTTPKPVSTQNNAVSAETLALFEFKAATELSERLSETPIADLKKALSLNDRILMTRELFSGDTKALDNTLATVQTLTTYEDAKSFLIQFCAEQNHWADKNRIESARNFIKLVRRRFK